MNSQEICINTLTNAWFVIAVINGRLVLNANLPLRWTTITIAIIAGATGYPIVLEIALKLLRAG